MSIRTKIDPTDPSLMDLLQRLPLNVRMCMIKSFKDEKIYSLCSQIGLVVRIIGNSVDRFNQLTDENVLETLNMAVKFRNKVKVSFRGVMDKSEVEKMINKQLYLCPALNSELIVSLDDDGIFVSVRKGVKK